MSTNIYNRKLGLNNVSAVTLGGRVLGRSRVSFMTSDAALLVDLGVGPMVQRGGFS